MPIASGANSVASALGHRPRRDPGAAVRTYHEGLSPAPKTGTFYLAGNRNFLLGSDRRQVVFSGPEDWHVYWKLYKGYSQQYALRTWGYCLMSNHIHLIAVPEREDSMARTLGRTNIVTMLVTGTHAEAVVGMFGKRGTSPAHWKKSMSGWR